LAKEKRRLERIQDQARNPPPLPKLLSWSVQRSQERQERLQKIAEYKEVMSLGT
jgi:hypothetical protein